MNHLQKQVVEDSELVLTDKEQNYLGPDLLLSRCRLVLRTNAKAITISNARLIGCKIDAKKKLINFQMWCGAAIKDCTFTGQFEGNDFGHWPQQHPNGSIEDCDFSNAVLNGCRFMDCCVDTIKLPRWPCFTVFHPYKLKGEVEAADWPGKLRYWADDLASQPTITHALVEHAPTLAKQFGCTEEQVLVSVQRLRNVLL